MGLLRGFLRAREQYLEKRDETDKRSINVHLRPEVYGTYCWSVSPISFRSAGSISPVYNGIRAAGADNRRLSRGRDRTLVVFYLGRIARQVTAISPLMYSLEYISAFGAEAAVRFPITRNPLSRWSEHAGLRNLAGKSSLGKL